MFDRSEPSGRDRASGTALSLWEETARGPADYPALKGPTRAEVAVVGGGFTGLSAALHLAEAGAAAVLVEAGQPGSGASGRNGGQVIPGLKLDPDKLEAALGPGALATAAGSADALFSLIERHGIACDAVRPGWVQLAETETEARLARARVKQRQRRGAPVVGLGHDKLKALTGSPAYREGWLDRRGGSVQPLSLARGLARTAAAAGARIHGSSRAVSLRREGSGWEVTTSAGSIRADKVLIATNGYTDGIWPGLARSIVPLHSMQIATDPLPEDMRRTILPGGETAADMRKLVRYFRIDPDGRFVIGSRGPSKDQPGAADTAFLERAARSIYPCLQAVPFRYRWSGRVAMTADHLPHLNRLAPGLYAGLGYNGRGVAMATLTGKLLAALAGGADEDSIGFPVVPLTTIPLHVLHRPIVQALIAYHRLRESLVPH